MTIRTTKEWSTDEWPGKEQMHAPPDWFGVSPEVIARRGRPWNQNPTDLPWLDRDGAQEKVKTRHHEGLITDQEAELLQEWVSQGYFIVRDVFDESDFGSLGGCVEDLEGLWTLDEPLSGLQVQSIHLDCRSPGPVDHAELLSFSLEERLDFRQNQPWRVHYFHAHSRAAMEVTRAKKILRMSELLLDEDPVLLSCIGFKWGSQVGLHQDLAAMHIDPLNRLVGVWVACEDVNPKAGPLGVYPDTHRVPIWSGWKNFPQTNLRTCHIETRSEEERYIHDAISGIERKPLVIKKGDVIFQHGSLIHGGDKIEQPGLTRFSLVLHYTVSGGDKMHEVEGPFNW